MQELQYRDTVLNIIFRLHQLRPEIVGPQLKPILYQHRQNLLTLMSQPEVDRDLAESLNEEISKIDEAIAAPQRPFVKNFE